MGNANMKKYNGIYTVSIILYLINKKKHVEWNWEKRKGKTNK